jgi:oligosaccharide repeat unit polymerase
MFDSIYIFLSLLNLFIFMRSWNFLNFLNPYVSFYIGFFLFVVFGGFYDGFENLYKIDIEIKIIILISFYLILFAGEIFKLFFLGLKVNMNRFSKLSLLNEINITSTNKYFNFYMLLVFILGVGLSIIAFSMMNVIPVLSSDVHVSRIEELSGKGFLFHPSRILIFISITYFSLLYLKTSSISLISLLMLILIGFLVLWGYAIRAEALKTIIYIIIMYLMLKKISVSNLILTLVIFLSFFLFNGLMQYARHYSLSSLMSVDFDVLLRFGWANVGHRFWVQLENLQFIYHNISEAELMGLTYINDLFVVLPGNSVTGGVILKEYIGLNFIGGGITPTILGEGYANFGLYFSLAFIFSFSLILLCVYYWMYIFLLKRRNHFSVIYYSSFFLIFSFGCYGFASTTFIGKIMMDLLPLVVIYSILIFVYNIISKSFVNVK